MFRASLAAVRVGIRETLPAVAQSDLNARTSQQQVAKELMERLQGAMPPPELPEANEEGTKPAARPVPLSGEARALWGELHEMESIYAETIGAPQEAILRRGYLSMAIAAFDALLIDLVVAYYKRKPSKLKDSQQTLKLIDLELVDDLDEAKHQLALQEAESALRQDFLGVEKYFRSTLGVSIAVHNEIRARVIECIQRRHLATHANMIVQRGYLKKVDGKLVEQFEVKVGEPLELSDEYLEEMLDYLQLYALMLVHCCATSWSSKSTLSNLSGSALMTQFGMLHKGRYLAVAKIAEFSDNLFGVTESHAKSMSLNQCTAHRKLDGSFDCSTLLNKHDWSACSMLLEIGYTIHMGLEDQFADVTKRALKAGEVSPYMIRSWPIFEFAHQFKTWQQILDACSDHEHED